jgi:Fungal trichothecene efflux pump (TRI12)
MGAVSMITIFFLRKDLKPGSISLSHPAHGQTRPQAFASGFAALDFGGIFLFIFGVGLVILATAWGGSTFPWKSAGVIVSLVIGALFIFAFVVYEKLFEPGQVLARAFPKTVPLVPFSLLRNKDIGFICFEAAGTGAAMYSVFYFIGIYFTLVEAYPASRAGVQLLYYIPGIGTGVYAAIFLCNVKPRQTFWPLFLGTIVETAAMAALAYAVKVRNRTLVNVMMAVAGGGTGVRLMPASLHLAGMFRDRLAPVYSLLRFSMPFGGTLALTIMGSVFQNEMAVYFGNANVQSQVPGSNGTSGFNLHNQAALEAVSRLPPAQQEAVRRRGAEATMWAFISILPFLGLSVLATAGLGNVWISKREKASQVVEETAGGEKGEDQEQKATATASGAEGESGRTNSEVLTGVYLRALATGRVRSQRKPGPTEKGPVHKVSEGEVAEEMGGKTEKVNQQSS